MPAQFQPGPPGFQQGFQGVAVPAASGVPQGLLMRGMRAVPYNGPTVERSIAVRRVRQAEIAAALARFRGIEDEDELVLGLMEAA